MVLMIVQNGRASAVVVIERTVVSRATGTLTSGKLRQFSKMSKVRARERR